MSSKRSFLLYFVLIIGVSILLLVSFVYHLNHSDSQVVDIPPLAQDIANASQSTDLMKYSHSGKVTQESSQNETLNSQNDNMSTGSDDQNVQNEATQTKPSASTGLNSVSQKASVITTAKTSKTSLQVYQEALGILDNSNQATISSEASGLVEKVTVSIGDYVKAGQVLAYVNRNSLLNTKKSQEAQLSNLRHQLVNQQKTVKRQKELLSYGYISQADMDQANLTEQSFKDQISQLKSEINNIAISIEKASVRSSVSGIVQDRNITKGNYVATGTSLFTVVNNKSMIVTASFPESNLSILKKNQKAFLTLPNGVVIKGLVKEIKPVIDSDSRSIQAIIDISNNKYSLKPGGTVSVKIITSVKKNAILVPERDVVIRRVGDVVYVVNGDRVREVPVKLGIYQGGKVEIVSGLKGNETLADDGAKSLDDNALISVHQSN